MPYVLRSTTDPTLAEIAQIPQIVIIDLTGPAVFLGTGPTSSLLVGEFLKGAYAPTAVGSQGELLSLYGSVSPFFSQSASGVQDGSGVSYNGNGMLQLKSKTFKKLVIQRVDCENVTTDGGATKATLAITLTIAAADQAAGVTNKDLIIPAGTRFADQAISTATYIVAASQDVKIAKGSTVTANAVTVNVKVFTVKVVDAAVVIPSATFDTVIDSTVTGASAGTSITSVVQSAGMWVPGTGATLSLRIDSKYLEAIDATAPSGDVTSTVRVIWSARRTSGASSATIQKRLLSNATNASAQNSQGRIALDSPDPSAGTDASSASAAKTAALAWGATNTLQSDRIFHCWPHTQIFSEELGSIAVTINPEGWMACVLSNLASEVNPGVQQPFMQGIVALEQAFVSNPLSKQDYIDLQAAGISAIQKDSSAGWWFVNGVTSVVPTATPTRVPIKRRMMADEVQGTIANIAGSYIKQPATTERVDAFVGEMKAYLDTLLSARDPSRQRIVGYSIDAVSGNEPNLVAVGIFTFLINVKLLPSMDDIVLRTQIGETVVLPVAQAA